MIRVKRAAFPSLLALIITATACFGPSAGGGIGGITLTLGPDRRDAEPWPADGRVLAQIDVETTITGGGEDVHRETKGGDTISAAVSPGQWSIQVLAYYPDKDTLYAQGYARADVQAGRNSVLRVHMNRSFVNRNPADPDPAVTGITASYSQGSTIVFPNTPLDSLKSGLTVTERYSNGTSAPVSGYTLSVFGGGALTV